MPQRREFITVLMMSRAVDASIRLGEESGTLPKLRHRDLILWLISNCFIQSAVGMKSNILNKGVRKFYETQARFKENEKILVQIQHRMLADGVPHY